MTTRLPQANHGELKTTAWLAAKAPSLAGNDMTIYPRYDNAGYVYFAKILAAKANLFRINLPRRAAGQGYLRESGRVTVNFVVDNVLYEATAEYQASGHKVRSLLITGDIQPATRRRYDRLPVRLKAAYVAVSDVSLKSGRLTNVSWRQSTTSDISGGGILIQTPMPAPVGSYLLLNLEIESFQGPIYIFGQVRWSGLSNAIRGIFQCGVMFIAREELPIHFSPQALSGIPAILRQFDRNSRNELDAFLKSLPANQIQGDSDVSQQDQDQGAAFDNHG